MSVSSVLAVQLLQAVGGKDNVRHFSHCATRLRLQLARPEACNDAHIRQLDGVLGTVTINGQYQIIIGHQVTAVYQQLAELSGQYPSGAVASESPKQRKKVALFDILSGGFLPLIGLLAGGGMLKVLLTVIAAVTPSMATQSSYHVLAVIANAPFWFLPALLGCSLAKRLGANPYMGLIIGASLLDPALTGLLSQPDSNFLGIPLLSAQYAYSVFPVFIAVSAGYWLEKGLLALLPDFLQLVLVPMLCLMIIIPVTLLVFGPFGMALGEQLARGITWLQTTNGLLCGVFVGAVYTFIVMMGLHWGLVPVILANLAQGGDPIFAIGGMAAFSQMGVALGVLLTRPPQKLRRLLNSALLPAMISGVTEPIIYGVMMPFRRLFLYAAIAAAIGGGFNGYYRVNMVTWSFASLPGIPAFSPTGLYLASVGITLASSALMVVMFGYRNRVPTTQEATP